MRKPLACPSCGARDLDLLQYDSMMVLRPDLALFSIHCSHCATKVSTIQPVPAQLREEVRFAAIEVGAGMGMQ